ncbi:hypothetical protein [Rhizorhabdus argentea]|uniref:hypothetical protein n=1 Tax=Rhizorhabdus argentea TaxID=1387174 RepID=UPI0030EBDAEC
MPAFTTNQWAILGLVLILGWFLGLLTMAGRRKWRRAFEQEHVERIAADAEVDRLRTRLSALEGERDRRIALEQERDDHIARATASNERIVELEKHRPSVRDGAAGDGGVAAASRRDDLARIFGVGRSGEAKLNELGIHRYADIITLSLSDEAALEQRMGLAPGTIADERWRDQAEMLRKGKFDEHARMFA